MRPLSLRCWMILLVGAASLWLGGCGDTAGNEEAIVPEDDSSTNATEDATSNTTEDATSATQEDTTPPPPTFPEQPFSIDTVLEASTVAAGQEVRATCLLLDDEGQPFGGTLPEGVELFTTYTPEASFIVTDTLATIAIRAGQAQVACAAPALRLVDTTPAPLTITAGPAHTTVPHLDPITITAGGQAEVYCDVFDEFGNPIPDALPDIVVGSADGVLVEGLSIQITRAGMHEVTCHVDGAQNETSQFLEVLPDLPFALALSVVPDESVYGLGQVVTLATIVTDRYGNVIPDAEVTYSSTGGTDFGEGRFRFDTEGVYTVSATVEGEIDPTAPTVPLQDSRQIIVNGNGPDIFCEAPFDGAMVNHTPGAPLTFSGSLADPNGVAALLVDGKPALINPDGTFSVDVATRYGLNFVSITADDSFGEQNTRTCAFLVADNWGPEDAFIDNTISLRLKQAAFDDGNRSGAINSVADLLHVVINSQELRNTLHAQLSASPNLKPLSCDQTVRICLPWPLDNTCWSDCVLQSSITYQNFTISGPNTVTLTLVDPATPSGPGGLRARVVLRNAALTVHAFAENPTTGLDLIDRNGTISIDDLTADLTFNVFLQNGTPRATVRSVNEVTLGDYSVSIQGIPQFLLDILLFFLEGTFRNLIEDQLEQFIRDSFGDVLDGLLSNLDISTLGTSFDVPRLDGSGNISLGFGVGFSGITVNAPRALFALKSRFTPSPIVNATPSLGVPFPPPPGASNLLDINTTRTAGVFIHVGMFNQVLHALWRGGLLDAQISGSSLGGALPEGVSVVVSAKLPPVALMAPDGSIELDLGGLRLSLVYPGLFDEPLTLNLGAIASATFSIQGNDLVFGGIQIQALHFSTEGISLDATSRDVLQSFLITLVQSIAGSALNDALPALPIPSFPIPSDLAAYGLPAGAVLGLISPQLVTNGNHFILDSDFGTLP